MPVIIRMQFEDGTDSVARFPAEIWRFNDVSHQKSDCHSKKVTQWTLDPYQEIADIDAENNAFPRMAQPTRFQLFKQQQRVVAHRAKSDAAAEASCSTARYAGQR